MPSFRQIKGVISLHRILQYITLTMLLIIASKVEAQYYPPVVGMCMNPSGALVPINGSLDAPAVSGYYPQYALLGFGTDGNTHYLQCDTNGNLLSNGNLTVGTTVINNGTSGNYEYNNNGVLSELPPPVFNVKAYGAKCNGSTDDTAAFTAAFTAAASMLGGGAIVYVPSCAAKYVLASSISIPEYVTLAGESGANGSTLEFTGTGGGTCSATNNYGYIDMAGGSSTLRDISVTTTQSAAATCMVHIGAGTGEVSNVHILRNSIIGGSTSSTNIGIYAGPTDSTEIGNNVIEYCAQHILSQGQNFIRINIHDNIFSWGTNSSDFMVQWGANSYGVRVVSNTFEGYGSDNGVYEAGWFNTISNNYFGDGNGTAGSIWINGGGKIESNYFEGAAEDLQANSPGNSLATQISNNQFNDPIFILGPSILTGNEFDDVATTSYDIHMQAAYITSQGNTFQYSTVTNSYLCYIAPCVVNGYLGDKDNSANKINSNVNWSDSFHILATTVTGTTAGTVVWSAPIQGSANVYKKVLLNFQGYENTTSTAQTITLSYGFTDTPQQGAGCPSGLVISTATITLPSSMGATFTGQCIVEGQ